MKNVETIQLQILNLSPHFANHFLPVILEEKTMGLKYN